MTDSISPAEAIDSSVILADVVRSGRVESIHRGHAVIVDADGAVSASWGAPWIPTYPRSSIKPLQAAGMVNAGLDLPPALLALAAASHSGESFHLEGVRRILTAHGLDESALQTPPDFAYDTVERDAMVRAGQGPTSLAMNCSGKHAAMLATCVVNGWPTGSYLAADHPLQVTLLSSMAELMGEPIAGVGVDGCGAPLVAVSLVGLARGVSACLQGQGARGASGLRVAQAMAAHPHMVGGSRRDVTDLMRGVPGAVAKDGAEGVYVVALADGRAAALKIEDGSQRARPVVMAALLEQMGVAAEVVRSQGRLPVLGGGQPVGEVRPVLAEAGRG